MTTKKPSKGEHEFIQREQARSERHKREKERLARTERERRERRALHFMKCPNCGGDMGKRLFHTVEVAHCHSCKGMWIDEDQLEQLAGRESTLLRDILEFFKHIGKGTPISEL